MNEIMESLISVVLKIFSIFFFIGSITFLISGVIWLFSILLIIGLTMVTYANKLKANRRIRLL